MTHLRTRQRPLRIASTTLGCAVLVAAIATISPQRAGTQDIALDSYHGRWLLEDTATNRQNIAGGIDRVVDQMNLFIREIARGEIHRRIPAEQRIHIQVLGEEHIALTFDTWGPHHYDPTGGVIRINNREGTRVQSSCRFRDGRLHHRQSYAQGARSNVLFVDPEANRLTMAVVITANQLPAEIHYRLTFSRAP